MPTCQIFGSMPQLYSMSLRSNRREQREVQEDIDAQIQILCLTKCKRTEGIRTTLLSKLGLHHVQSKVTASDHAVHLLNILVTLDLNLSNDALHHTYSTVRTTIGLRTIKRYSIHQSQAQSPHQIRQKEELHLQPWSQKDQLRRGRSHPRGFRI